MWRTLSITGLDCPAARHETANATANPQIACFILTLRYNAANRINPNTGIDDCSLKIDDWHTQEQGSCFLDQSAGTAPLMVHELTQRSVDFGQKSYSALIF